jgi:hypothetical protein
VTGAFSRGDEHSLAALAPNIGYRLSAGLDRYVLIFHAHLYTGYAPAYASEYAVYLGKSFANLILPGTPYKEAYMPSSSLLPALLVKAPLLGETSKTDLIRSLNTQPYTIFGVATILAGLGAPVLLFVAFGFLSLAYRMVRWIPARVAMIYMCMTALMSYGIEVVVANAVHIGLSLAIFIWLMRVVRSGLPREVVRQAASAGGS